MQPLLFSALLVLAPAPKAPTLDDGFYEVLDKGEGIRFPSNDGRTLLLGKSLGKDVGVCPCKTIVPFYRNHVFAQIKPSTQTRIDFGLSLASTKARGRLIDTGGLAKKDRITHRIPISSVHEIDDEVKRWAKAAYDMDRKA